MEQFVMSPRVLHGVLSSDCQDEARRQREQSGLALFSLQGTQRVAGPVWSDTERLASNLVLLPRLQVDPTTLNLHGLHSLYLQK